MFSSDIWKQRLTLGSGIDRVLKAALSQVLYLNHIKNVLREFRSREAFACLLRCDTRWEWGSCTARRTMCISGEVLGGRCGKRGADKWRWGARAADGITLVIVMSDPKRRHGKQSIPLDFFKKCSIIPRVARASGRASKQIGKQTGEGASKPELAFFARCHAARLDRCFWWTWWFPTTAATGAHSSWCQSCYEACTPVLCSTPVRCFSALLAVAGGSRVHLRVHGCDGNAGAKTPCSPRQSSTKYSLPIHIRTCTHTLPLKHHRKQGVSTGRFWRCYALSLSQSFHAGVASR